MRLWNLKLYAAWNSLSFISYHIAPTNADRSRATLQHLLKRATTRERERKKASTKESGVKNDEKSWREIVIGFSSLRGFTPCSWNKSLRWRRSTRTHKKTHRKIDRITFAIMVLVMWLKEIKIWINDLIWDNDLKCWIINAVNHKEETTSQCEARLTKMDYNKIKLLFIVLASELIASQTLNNLNYGELRRDSDE